MRQRLRRACRERDVVSFTRPFETGSVLGYVCDVGPDLFTVALLESMRFNGFQVFRIRDVRNLLVPHRHAPFVEEWLRLSRQRVPSRRGVRATGVGALLKAASRAFRLVTVHREKADPDVCHIGQVIAVDKKSVTLREIDPDAHWDAQPCCYRLAEITRLDFGGGYEEALASVAEAGEQAHAPDGRRGARGGRAAPR